MRPRTLGLAAAAGVAAFVVVGVAVTELALAWIEFSLFVGLPAGVVAGAAAAAAVLVGLAEDAPAGRRRAAASVGGFGVGFIAALLVAGVVGTSGAVQALVLAAAVGLAVAAATYYRGAPGAD